MAIITISVEPLDIGWTLRAPPLGEDLYFLCGVSAGAAGRNLARRLAQAGHRVELEVVLPDGAVARYLDPLAA